MATNPVVLILGSGPRIGTAVAKKFAGNGYKVAIVSRNGTGTNTTEGYLSLKADFAKPDTIPALFETIKKTFQTSPSVVIYNAGSLTPPPVADDIFSVPAERVESDLVVNAVSPYVAAQQAVSGWKTLPEGTKKTFIYTGNITNVATIPVPLFLNLGIGKSAASSWVGLADVLYSKTGVRLVFFSLDGEIF